MDSFEKYLEGKSEKTIYEYSLDVRKFLEWKKGKTISKELLDEYVADLMETLSIVTVNRKINSLNQYLKYLDLPIHLKNKKIQGHTFIDDMLSNEDVFKMYHEADERTKLIIETLYLTGLRVSEMLQIKTRHINKSEIIIRGKGDKFRTIFIPDGLKESWKKYAEKHNIQNGNLFTGQRGKITRSTVFISLKKTAEKCGVDVEKVYCHAFRHLFAKNLDAAGVSYSAGKQLMGHSLGTQDLYRSFSKKELLDVLNNLYQNLAQYI